MANGLNGNMHAWWQTHKDWLRILLGVVSLAVGGTYGWSTLRSDVAKITDKVTALEAKVESITHDGVDKRIATIVDKAIAEHQQAQQEVLGHAKEDRSDIKKRLDKIEDKLDRLSDWLRDRSRGPSAGK